MQTKHYPWQILSGSTLKILAVITMLIDHMGASILERASSHPNGLAGGVRALQTKLPFLAGLITDGQRLMDIDWKMRMIGRLAFPIYCFLLVEGIKYTHSKLKYLTRLLIFALVSEIPFDFCFEGKLFEWSHQNVFWTMALAVGAMWVLEYTQENCRTYIPIAGTEDVKGDERPSVMTLAQVEGYEKEAAGARHLKPVGYTARGLFFRFAAVILAVVLGFVLRTDYNGVGVACILCLYVLREKQILECVFGALVFWFMESFLTVPLAFVPVLFYGGKRGLKMKYFFYAFYPVHLLLLGLFVRFYLGY